MNIPMNTSDREFIRLARDKARDYRGAVRDLLEEALKRLDERLDTYQD